MNARQGLLLSVLLFLGGFILVGIREFSPDYAAYAGNRSPVVLIPSLTNKP